MQSLLFSSKFSQQTVTIKPKVLRREVLRNSNFQYVIISYKENGELKSSQFRQTIRSSPRIWAKTPCIIEPSLYVYKPVYTREEQLRRLSYECPCRRQLTEEELSCALTISE